MDLHPVKRYLYENDIKIKNLAKKCDLSESTLIQYLRWRKPISHKTAFKISRGLEAVFTPDQIYSWTPKKTAETQLSQSGGEANHQQLEKHPD